MLRKAEARQPNELAYVYTVFTARETCVFCSSSMHLPDDEAALQALLATKLGARLSAGSLRVHSAPLSPKTGHACEPASSRSGSRLRYLSPTLSLKHFDVSPGLLHRTDSLSSGEGTPRLRPTKSSPKLSFSPAPVEMCVDPGLLLRWPSLPTRSHTVPPQAARARAGALAQAPDHDTVGRESKSCGEKAPVELQGARAGASTERLEARSGSFHRLVIAKTFMFPQA